MTPHVRAVRRLYREVLTVHRSLPPEFRSLGNTYARDEFRRHKDAKAEFVGPFMREWTHYVDMVTRQLSVAAASSSAGKGAVVVGAPLDADRAKMLSDEQVGQLYELRTEIRRPTEENASGSPATK
eukprot:Opistho-2@52524